MYMQHIHMVCSELCIFHDLILDQTVNDNAYSTPFFHEDLDVNHNMLMLGIGWYHNRGGKRGTAAYCRGLHGVTEKWASPMDRLSRQDERPDDRTRQAARSQTSWGQRNLETTDGQVPALSDGAGGQDRLWD